MQINFSFGQNQKIQMKPHELQYHLFKKFHILGFSYGYQWIVIQIAKWIMIQIAKVLPKLTNQYYT